MQVGALAGAGAGAAVMQFGARASQSMELSIVTAEGDRVTLSASSTRALGYAGAVGVGDGEMVAAAAWQVNATTDVSLKVEGSLSREELVDLRKVIKAFRQAAARGDASRLLHRLTRPDLDTIASVAGRVSVESSSSAAVLAA